jgi:hypothetical protein
MICILYISALIVHVSCFWFTTRQLVYKRRIYVLMMWLWNSWTLDYRKCIVAPLLRKWRHCVLLITGIIQMHLQTNFLTRLKNSAFLTPGIRMMSTLSSIPIRTFSSSFSESDVVPIGIPAMCTDLRDPRNSPRYTLQYTSSASTGENRFSVGSK